MKNLWISPFRVVWMRTIILSALLLRMNMIETLQLRVYVSRKPNWILKMRKHNASVHKFFKLCVNNCRFEFFRTIFMFFFVYVSLAKQTDSFVCPQQVNLKWKILEINRWRFHKDCNEIFFFLKRKNSRGK